MLAHGQHPPLEPAWLVRRLPSLPGRLPAARVAPTALQPAGHQGRSGAGWSSTQTCLLVKGREALEGAQQPCGGEGCWTWARSADDALIRFPNSILHSGYAARRTLQRSKKRIPEFARGGVCTNFSAARTSCVSETGLQLPQAKPKQPARSRVSLSPGTACPRAAGTRSLAPHGQPCRRASAPVAALLASLAASDSSFFSEAGDVTGSRAALLCAA